MRKHIAIILAAALLLVAARCIQAADSPASAANPATGANPATHGQAAITSGDAWRYVNHNGRWWYWLPTEKWVYWVGDRWVNYDPAAAVPVAAAPAASGARTQQSYSYSDPRAAQGNWGPVYYNRYGQPQYPYSQRTSGIRQLGPVPAPGGLRSLPGWGGER